MTFYFINPFPATFPILYPLKTQENQRFSGVFREYEMGKTGFRNSYYSIET